MIYDKVKILEFDGGNCPSWHIFKDFAQAANYIGCDVADLEESSELYENGSYWWVMDDLYAFDHTKEVTV